jgi:hypothetical protein
VCTVRMKEKKIHQEIVEVEMRELILRVESVRIILGVNAERENDDMQSAIEIWNQFRHRKPNYVPNSMANWIISVIIFCNCRALCPF